MSTLTAQTVLKVNSREDLAETSVVRLDLHLVSGPEKEEAPASESPRTAPARVIAATATTRGGEHAQHGKSTRSAPAKVTARVGSVDVKVGKS